MLKISKVNFKCSGEPTNMAAWPLQWTGQPSFYRDDTVRYYPKFPELDSRHINLLIITTKYLTVH